MTVAVDVIVMMIVVVDVDVDAVSDIEDADDVVGKNANNDKALSITITITIVLTEQQMWKHRKQINEFIKMKHILGASLKALDFGQVEYIQTHLNTKTRAWYGQQLIEHGSSSEAVDN